MVVHRQLHPVGDRSDTGPSSQRPIRVVLADDHPLMRRSLRRLLDREAGIEVVAEADDLPTVIRHLDDCRPQVLLLDLRMPDGSTIDAIRRLRLWSPSTEIIVLTMEDSPAVAGQALDAGAIGVVLKHFADVELGRAVRAGGRGVQTVSPRIEARRARHTLAAPVDLRGRF